MKKLTRILSFMLVLVMLLNVMPMQAEAATAKPSKTTVKSIKQTKYKSGKATLKITWKKVKKNCKGYTIYTRKNSKSKWKSVKTVSGANKTSATINIKAEDGSRIYVAIKPYNKNGKKKVYGKQSSSKNVRIKKTNNSNKNTYADKDDKNDKNTSNTDCNHNWKAKTHTVTVTDKAAYDETTTVTKAYDWRLGGTNVVCDDHSLYNLTEKNHTYISDKSIVVNAAIANEPNCKLEDGTLVTELGALFTNVTLVAGYGFPRELFYPTTYNGEEVKFWDDAWMQAHPEVETIATANKTAYTKKVRHIYYSMPTSMGCRTIDSMLYHQGKGRVGYDQNSSNILYFEKTKSIGNEMLWDYFRPGVAHTEGEPFTYTTTETVHHDAVTHTETVTDGYTCTKCGATK